MEKKSKNKTISVIVTEEMRDTLDKIAKQRDRNLSYIVREAITQYINGYWDCEESK